MQRFSKIGGLLLFCSLSLIVLSNAVRAATMRINDIPLGKVITINGQKFIKVHHDATKGSHFLALTPFNYQQVFHYTGSAQTWIAPYAGTYKVELWGAQGGFWPGADTVNYAAFVAGEITLNAGDIFYVYVGNTVKNNSMTFNGGGTGVPDHGPNGGGATDIRLINGNWDDQISLRNRLMVAAGSGGMNAYTAMCGNAGSLTGYDGCWYGGGGGGTQVSGGARTGGSATVGQFGIGGIGHTETNNSLAICNGSGGGGYYGGGGGYGMQCATGGGGGSSYISGHTGSVAITSATDQTPKAGCTTGTSNNTCSIHYSGKVFTNTVMIDGAGYAWTNVKGAQVQMPNPSGGNYALGVGHSGNGAARITLI